MPVRLKKPRYGATPSGRGPNKENRPPNVEPVVVVTPPRNNLAAYNAKVKAGLLPPNPPPPRPAASRASKDLQRIIQQIGNEEVDPQTGWTRIVAIIRQLYLKALKGDLRAMALLFERGWGKAVVPVTVDVHAELRELRVQMNLSDADIQADPVLREIFSEDEFGNVDRPVLPDRPDVVERAGLPELVRPGPVSGDSHQLFEPGRMVEDGGGT